VTRTSRIPCPDWIEAGRVSKGFEKSSAVILIMGETGKALRPSIIKEMAQRLDLSVENNIFFAIT
jgi:hypothetical protein